MWILSADGPGALRITPLFLPHRIPRFETDDVRLASNVQAHVIVATRESAFDLLGHHTVIRPILARKQDGPHDHAVQTPRQAGRKQLRAQETGFFRDGFGGALRGPPIVTS
jgi:hypothetical protein